MALPVLAAQFGNDSFEMREAMNSEIGWCKFFDPAKARALIEKEWLEHPLCEHLKPIEDYLRMHGVEMWREEGNTRPGVKIFARACLDMNSIRERLTLNSCVEIFEDPPGSHSWYLKRIYLQNPPPCNCRRLRPERWTVSNLLSYFHYPPKNF
ncbi:MAG: hypothetical protein WBN75_16660 [Verrucomicrobiia bacterium]|jgi:hypothetical protein